MAGEKWGASALTRQLTSEAKGGDNRVKRIFLLVLCFWALAFTTAAHAAGAYRLGDEGGEIASIQQRLNELGFNAGPVDGDFGPQTAQAVKAFQRTHGLPADGVVGPYTYRALMGVDIPVSRGDTVTMEIRRIIQTATSYLGVPYVFGGTTPSGFDCSGFVRYVFAVNGVSLPRTADAQWSVGWSVPSSQLRPGDLVFFSTYEAGPSHDGIYLGDGRFISATSSRGVAVDSLYSSYWGPRYIGAKRVI